MPFWLSLWFPISEKSNIFWTCRSPPEKISRITSYAWFSSNKEHSNIWSECFINEEWCFMTIRFSWSISEQMVRAIDSVSWFTNATVSPYSFVSDGLTNGFSLHFFASDVEKNAEGSLSSQSWTEPNNVLLQTDKSELRSVYPVALNVDERISSRYPPPNP